MKMGRKILTLNQPVHPLLFVIYPILFLYAHNIRDLSYQQLFIPLLIAVVSASLLWLFMSLIIKDKHISSATVSLFITVFFLYGHIFELLEKPGTYISVYRHYQIIAALLLAFVYFTCYLRRKSHLLNLKNVSVILNIMGILLVAYNIIAICLFNLNQGSIIMEKEDVSASFNIQNTFSTRLEQMPDLYYIIMDEYAGADVIKDIYDYDNSDLADYLSGRGFYIAGNSKTRYSSTFQCLSSALNMNYVNSGIPSVNLYSSVLNNGVSKILKEKGYKYLFNSSMKLYDGTLKNPFADYDYEKLMEFFNLEGNCRSALTVNDFHLEIIRTSMLRPLCYRLKMAGLAHREEELAKIDILKKVHEIEGPNCIFSHHEITHQPFVFSKSGQFVRIADHNNWKNKDIYLGAYIFNTKVLVEIVDVLLDLEEKPIIVIQSDHGPRGGIAESNKTLDVGEAWKSIFNVIYFPDQDYSMLYDSISPANVFRVIMNKYFEGNYKMLED